MWTLTNPEAALFQIAEHCNREQLTALIGAYPGIVISDRWPGYEHLDAASRQACWSHLRRDFRRHSEGQAEQKTFGDQGLQLSGCVFAAWRAYQHDHHDRERLQAEIDQISSALRPLVEHAARKSPRTRHHRRFANNLLKIWPALWTFAAREGVEPTTTPPNARSAARSSTANSPTAPAAAKANDSPNAPFPPPPPAASKTARCSATYTN